ncbi:cytosolic leucyl tRNA synthetase [Geranomyces variabilis]|uniref:leucine--tRNA ligase n=1 Tax=Geranomyces variabilis TaxID=109894 RepID=A0AAD5XNH7_9FUNG|nr:cytosolic leucyl tRNA synthetase [Geranomyces variabilis]
MSTIHSEVTATSTTTQSDVAESRKGTQKLEALQKEEKWAQQKWEDERIFEVDAPAPGEPSPPKFMGTFPFPYMNGLLHLGHSFSLTKLEFACGYERLQGKRVLFPFGFHVTGMPIKACADKLKKEIEMFGEDFSGYVAANDEPADAAPKEESVDPTKIVKKHGKAAAKKTGLTYQFQIMRSMGIPNEEIKLFADAKHWLYYFPPGTREDLKDFGLSVDWRRSFFTTDVNPYFDSFVRWQFNTLHKRADPKVKYGERYTIYSPLDGQPCMDHDRASGEGVGVQEYTGIKLQVLMNELTVTGVERDLVKGVPVGQALTTPEFQKALAGRNLYLVAGTLRPETMYGQTNCFVGVDIVYGIYAVNDKEAWVCTPRSARNMAFQKLFGEPGTMKKLGEVKGIDLVGVPLNAPLSKYERVYTLPMEGVLANKGTGVVTSVPSDSPDDYITLQDLKKKAAYYNVQPKWVEPFADSFPSIIRTPNYGDRAAEAAVKKFKINSQKDKLQLTEAKAEVYKEGFYQGTMIIGNHAGKTVQEAKPLIRDELIAQGLAFPYCEPEGMVMSRSGDECVVTLAPQWYIDYGEEGWKKLATLCLADMETYSPETRHQFERTLDWLNQWACSRSFGLGTRLPWDPKYLIESLSDSTIYMAYYTVAHMLQGGVLDGSKRGSGNIGAEQMTDEVWNYVLLNGPMPETTSIPKETLEKMRREFEYFYPLDVRVSGKDLVQNHLTFFIYNHTAIFPQSKWPKGVRVNGHLLLNGEKMSKSTGNFMTIKDALKVFGADATRFALADAGDGVEDANFLEKTADDAILKLYTEREWIEENLAAIKEGGKKLLRTGAYTWNDRVFAAELDKLVADTDAAYKLTWYREALKLAFYEMTTARSEYRKATTGATGAGSSAVQGDSYEGMHVELVLRYIELQTLMMSPITPHWSEYIWSQLLHKPESIKKALWPKQTGTPDEGLLAAAAYIRGLGSKIRSAEDQAARKEKKKKSNAAAAAITTPTSPAEPRLRLFVASSYPAWQDAAITILKSTYKDGVFAGTEKQLLAAAGLMKNKAVMPFVAGIKSAVEADGPAAFERKLAFDEVATLESNLDFVRRELSVLKIKDVELVKAEEVKEDGKFAAEDVRKADMATPSQPTYRIV